MPRWRPPVEHGTALITPEGQRRLKAELEHLWRQRRPEVVRALAAAAAEGDRSENAEYTYRKRQLADLDRRVRYLSKRLSALKVVQEPPADPLAIFFGAWLRLEDESGREHRYRIVGPDETDAAAGHISVDSPLARALLRHRVDEVVAVELPLGRTLFVVLAVSYAGPADA
ncbi:MAG: transcription elongation factor GreB [Pseudomonadota bacterium]|jgi:transcription elongation factor GreB